MLRMNPTFLFLPLPLVFSHFFLPQNKVRGPLDFDFDYFIGFDLMEL